MVNDSESLFIAEPGVVPSVPPVGGALVYQQGSETRIMWPDGRDESWASISKLAQRAARWKRVARKHFQPRVDFKKAAKALLVVEQALYEIAHPDFAYQMAKERAQVALDAIQPMALAHNPGLGEKRWPLHILHMDLTSLHLRGDQPHWAMYRIAQSLGQSMLQAPNYMTAIMQTGKPEGPRFEVTLRQLGKGKTAHELREEAEAKVKALEGELAASAPVKELCEYLEDCGEKGEWAAEEIRTWLEWRANGQACVAAREVPGAQPTKGGGDADCG